MESLPLELHIHHIFNHIDTPSIVRSKRVSKDWKNAIDDILPSLDINLSNNQFISDGDLEVFSKNKNINLSYCPNLTASTMWCIWPDKLNIMGCLNLGDCVFKYLSSVKELAMDYNEYGYRVKNEVFSDLEKLIVKSSYGSGYDIKMIAPKLNDLTITDFMISPELFSSYPDLRKVHFTNCTFSNFYYDDQCTIIESIQFNNCNDRVYYEDYDMFENTTVFIINKLRDDCLITYHGKIIETQIDITNITKKDFLEHNLIKAIIKEIKFE